MLAGVGGDPALISCPALAAHRPADMAAGRRLAPKAPRAPGALPVCARTEPVPAPTCSAPRAGPLTPAPAPPRRPARRTLTALYAPLTAATGAPRAAPLFASWNEERRATARRRSVRDTWLCMLCALPGFGQTLAQAVVAAHPTPRSLFEAYSEEMRSAVRAGRDAVAAARGLLSRAARLSAARSAQVYDDLFASGWHVV